MTKFVCRRVIVFVSFIVVYFSSFSPSYADDRICEGPTTCCPKDIVDRIQVKASVAVGVVLIGFSNVNERQGSWDADYYLYEEWEPIPGFTPQTEVVNEIERKVIQFDDTRVHHSVCVRSRRIRSTLQSDYNLRTFPFDHQQLKLTISDDQFDNGQVQYRKNTREFGIDDSTKRAISGWSIEGDANFFQEAKTFRWEVGAPAYDYATFSVGIGRHAAFHVIRYFLPLLIIVIIAFSVFWIDPEDLNSQISIGVTCVLAAIALQLAEAGTLPEVSYLTLADRGYAVCYVGVALAICTSIYSNALVRNGNKSRAVAMYRHCRWIFPSTLILTLGLETTRALAFSG